MLDIPLREHSALIATPQDASYNRHMPIYEYECTKCNAHVEAFQKVSDKPLTKCSKCKGKLERKISAPAIQFKGSGWYVTDYARTTKSEKSESESTSETKTVKTEKKSSPAKKTDKPSPSKTTSGD